MFSTFRPIRFAAVLALSASALIACDGATEPDEIEPEIAGLTLTVGAPGSGSITITPAGQTGQATLKLNQNNPITVRVLGVSTPDEPVIVADAAEFEIRMTASGTNQFTKTGTTYPYTGTLRPTTTGNAVYSAFVYALEHGHQEGATFNVSFNVAP